MKQGWGGGGVSDVTYPKGVSLWESEHFVNILKLFLQDTLFCFYVDHCGPPCCIFFFLVVHSRCCAFTAPHRFIWAASSRGGRKSCPVFIVSLLLKVKFSVTVSPLAFVGTHICVCCLLFINQYLSKRRDIFENKTFLYLALRYILFLVLLYKSIVNKS